MASANKEVLWTDEQTGAISGASCNFLVAAAAGAGKTAVLVERIIRKITDAENPVDIDRLLVVTFTNAAAAEMRERIGASLGRILDEAQRGGRKDMDNLQRQLALLGKAGITTIHSFCLDVIRNYFHMTDLDPAFRIADDTEALLLQMEALEELFESRYEPENCTEEFLNLVECYGSRDDSRLMELVLDIYGFVRSHPWPEVWLEEAAEDFNVTGGLNFGDTKWAKELIKSAAVELLGLREALGKAIRTAEISEGLSPYIGVLQEDNLRVKSMLEACSDKNNWDRLHGELRSLEFSRLPNAGKTADATVREEVKGLRDDVKGRLNKMKKEFISGDSEELVMDMRQLYPVMKSLIDLVLEFIHKYREKKKQKNVVDFSDLEHYCLKVLTERKDGKVHSTQAARELRRRFEEIFIDEYQDSNLTQEVVLNMVSREEEGSPNIFMVGDVKQSIYRFRQAKPELFLQKYNAYPEDPDSRYRKIRLYKNFRSREEIVNGVNYIFSRIMSKGLGDIEYTEDESLNPGAVFDALDTPGLNLEGAVELHIIDCKEAEAPDIEESDGGPDDVPEAALDPDMENEDILDSVQCEVRMVAKRIKELVSEAGTGFMVFDRSLGKYRPAQYKDIVILMRATRNWADIFAEELSLQGLPVFTDIGIGYFETIEISTVLSLLQIIDNPLQDIPMLAVLRSPIAGFEAGELIDIRMFDREAAYYEAMCKAAEADDDTGRKTAGFIEKLDRWREKSQYLSTDELIWYLYNDTGYYSFAGAMPDGVARQANLRMLFDKARQYEESSFKGLFNFVNFVNKLKSSRDDTGSAKILGENDDVVRIMSIHKSKGLEFPIVFLCGTGKGFNLADSKKSILLHHDLGIGPDLIDPGRRIWYPSIFKQSLKCRIRLENLSEEMRILYVAFTRAKEKLIITGSVKDINKSAVRWAVTGSSEDRRVPEHKLLKGKSYMDWICSALMRHPSGQLAEKLGVEAPECYGVKDSSQWDIKLWDREEILRKADFEKRDKEKSEDEAAPTSAGPETNIYDEIAKILEWEYPYSAYERLPVKVTVTELSQSNMQGMPVIIKRPGFLEEATEMTAAEKGSLLHFVLQHIDFKGEGSEAGIRQQIEKMVIDELLTDTQRQNINIRKIVKFMQSGLGRRMVGAQRLYREIPFTMEVSCREAFGSAAGCGHEDEMIILQGVIDCYFEEGNGIILVDYKTDFVPMGGAEQLKEKYRAQIEYYARALKQITGKEVAGKYIYSFWMDTAVEI